MASNTSIEVLNGLGFGAEDVFDAVTKTLRPSTSGGGGMDWLKKTTDQIEVAHRLSTAEASAISAESDSRAALKREWDETLALWNQDCVLPPARNDCVPTENDIRWRIGVVDGVMAGDTNAMATARATIDSWRGLIRTRGAARAKLAAQATADVAKARAELDKTRAEVAKARAEATASQADLMKAAATAAKAEVSAAGARAAQAAVPGMSTTTKILIGGGVVVAGLGLFLALRKR